MSILDWTTSETISPPRTIVVDFVRKDSGIKGSVSLTSTSTSKTTTTYAQYSVNGRRIIGADGSPTSLVIYDLVDAVSATVQVNRSTQAAVNTAYVASRLSLGLGLPSGDANTEIETFNTYRDGGTGVGLQIEEKVENTYISIVQLAGSLPIPSYEFYSPSPALVQSQKRVTKYFYATGPDGREYTKTETSSWMALALSQEGSQGSREQFKQLLEAAGDIEDEAAQGDAISSIVNASAELIFEGTEVQITLGRIPAPVRPPIEDILRDEIENGIRRDDDFNSTDNWRGWNNDFNGDGIPDWARFAPGDWLGFNQDSNGDGIPDWASFVPNDNRFTPRIGGPSVGGPTFGGGTDGGGFGGGGSGGIGGIGGGGGGGGGGGDDGGDDFGGPNFGFGPDLTRNLGDTKFVTAIPSFMGGDYVPADSTSNAIYRMPFAPDDVFRWVDGIRRLIPGGAKEAARKFGRTEFRLQLGHAYGQNIVTGWNEIPTEDLAPVYIRINGIQAAFLTDATSYAWDGNGMVVSSDLMLLGTNGFYGEAPPDETWVRLPVLIENIPELD
jgi:uncharacterized membrane protein YgcG